MALAFLVYFGLMAALIVCWSMPAYKSSLGYTQALHAGNQALIASVVIFTLLIGGRYNVGGDFFGYIDYYRYSSLSDKSTDVVFEPGFLLLIQSLKLFGLPDRAIIFASSFLQILLLALWLRKHPQIAPFVAFTFTVLLLLDVNNIIRQGIALFALFLAVSALNERRWLAFFAWVTLGYLFHRSALIILPLCAIVFWLRMPAVYLQVAALVISYGSVELFFDRIVGIFEILSPVFGYSGYSDVTRADLAFVKGVGSSFNIGTYLWPILDTLVILYSKNLSKHYKVMGYDRYHYLFLIAALLQPIANAWDFLPFARALFYFVAMRSICIGFLLHYCVIESRKPREIVVAAGISLVLILWLAVAILRGAAWSAPYQFS